MFTSDIEDYLQEVRIPIRLSCTTGSGWPIVLSLWFLYEDGYLYCATRDKARVVEYLTIEPRCGFEIARDQPPYCGVRGQALAEIDQTRGAEKLKKLIIRYLGDLDNPLAKNLLSRSEEEVAIRIRPVQIYTWNYTERMKDSIPSKDGGVCPD